MVINCGGCINGHCGDICGVAVHYKLTVFNIGWLCPNCGPIPDGKKRSLKKVQRMTCRTCESVVMPWQRPLNERSGRCNNCGYAAFQLAMVKGYVIRKCKHCAEVYNVETKNRIRPGDAEKAYTPD